ncbi:MAG: COP9 signalosome [Lentinula lateritia]|uniref:COP9 signalosome n=1 Tax=Lentinula lateritia TaxID=40482 RepID=A0ABQ8VHJ4_9AGAR|nr:MAG: COP9 signalosome [Lentinula lateritia]KAJ4491861.1 COP9 signalosome [Lentinula lateritia]
MANGPPTPPPTTDVEIQDEARMNDTLPPAVDGTSDPAPDTTSAQPPPQQPIQLQDPYGLIFPKIAELATQKRWIELIDIAEITEINANDDHKLSRLFVIVPLVLAYLIKNDLPIAKLVLERLPPDIRLNPLIKNLGLLATSYSAGAYEQIYSNANALVNAVAKPEFQQPELAQVINIMVESFLFSFRDRTFLLLSRAYTSITLSLAEMYFGLGSSELLPVAARHGWAYDTSTKVLKPVPTNEPASFVAPAVSSLVNFNFIAQSVSQLEM